MGPGGLGDPLEALAILDAVHVVPHVLHEPARDRAGLSYSLCPSSEPCSRYAVLSSEGPTYRGTSFLRGPRLQIITPYRINVDAVQTFHDAA